MIDNEFQISHIYKKNKDKKKIINFTTFYC